VTKLPNYVLVSTRDLITGEPIDYIGEKGIAGVSNPLDIRLVKVCRFTTKKEYLEKPDDLESYTPLKYPDIWIPLTNVNFVLQLPNNKCWHEFFSKLKLPPVA